MWCVVVVVWCVVVVNTTTRVVCVQKDDDFYLTRGIHPRSQVTKVTSNPPRLGSSEIYATHPVQNSLKSFGQMCMVPGATRSKVNHIGITLTRQDESLNIVLRKTQRTPTNLGGGGRGGGGQQKNKQNPKSSVCGVTQRQLCMHDGTCVDKLGVRVSPSRQPASKSGYQQVSQVIHTYTIPSRPQRSVRYPRARRGLCLRLMHNGRENWAVPSPSKSSRSGHL